MYFHRKIEENSFIPSIMYNGIYSFAKSLNSFANFFAMYLL
jgi:hypothetical protein